MASRQLAKTERWHGDRAEDTAKARQVAERFPGWNVWCARDGSQRVASRIGNQKKCPSHDGCAWAATLIGDSWLDLETQLQAQAEHDAPRTNA